MKNFIAINLLFILFFFFKLKILVRNQDFSRKILVWERYQLRRKVIILVRTRYKIWSENVDLLTKFWCENDTIFGAKSI